MDTQKEMKEVFDDAKRVHKLLNDNNITTKQFLHSIPVILSEVYPDKGALVEVCKMLTTQAIALHKIIYKGKR